MTETQQRFLRAIAERVPVHQVVELHLFPPIRQGGVETGVAVVAEDPRRPLPNAEPGVPDHLAAVTADPVPVAANDVEDILDAEVLIEVVDETAPEICADGAEPAALLDEVETEADVEPAEPVIAASYAERAEETIVDELDEESPYADDDADDDADGDEDDDALDVDEVVAESNGHARPAPVSRFTIHTARYRLTLKGVDRGKWEVDVVAEADAPLEAVDAVVRGVQRRAGEGAEPDRLNAEAFRGALEAPLATLER